MILMTMIIHLLPDKKYEKYLRLFIGVEFLMLVLSPFADLTGMEEHAAEAFARLTFQNDAKMLRKEIEDADGARMRKLVENYEDVIENDVRMMTEELGTECRGIRVKLDEDLEGGTFGRVVFVEMAVSDSKRIAELKSRIGAYYGLKDGEIAIHLEDE